MPVACYALTGTPTPIRPKEKDECRGIKSSPEGHTSCRKAQCLLPCGLTKDKLLFSRQTVTQTNTSLSRGVLKLEVQVSSARSGQWQVRRHPLHYKSIAG